MNKLSEKQKLYKFVVSQYPEWVSGIKIEAWALDGWKMKAETAGRRARELYREGCFERRINGKRCVEYKAVSQDKSSEELNEQKLLMFATG